MKAGQAMTKPLRKNVRGKPKKTVLFLHKPACATCQKACRFMQRRGYKLNFRDITRNKLSPAELEKLIRKGDHEEFLNTRSELYQKEKMKEHPPSRRVAIGMMVMDPNLIRRPVIVAGGRVVIGYDENGMIRF